MNLNDLSDEEIITIAKIAKQKADDIRMKSFICNYCGLSCNVGPNGRGNGLLDADVYGGYSSPNYGALDDATKYSFSLCEFCLDWLFCQFKIPVSCSEGDFVPATVRNSYNKEENSEFFTEKSKRDNARKHAEIEELGVAREELAARRASDDDLRNVAIGVWSGGCRETEAAGRLLAQPWLKK